MSESSPPSATAKINAACPNCGKMYAIAAGFLGRHAKCKHCEQTFTVTAAAPATAAAPSGSGEILCPVCQSPLASGEPTHNCPVCQTAHHKDCWDYNKGCGLYGCKEAPETEKLQEIEIPASFWGQTEKKCPRCQNVIQAAAVRCRHCGTEFKSARPTEFHEFRSEQQLKTSLPFHRTFGMILLFAAILPCTAPFAAVGGLIWYFVFRKQISALPPLNATIGRIAVWLACAVTILLIVFGALYSAFHSSGSIE